MTEPETTYAEGQRSSVKLALNSKGDTQIEVKVYVGDEDEAVEHARDLAISVFNETLQAVGR